MTPQNYQQPQTHSERDKRCFYWIPKMSKSFDGLQWKKKFCSKCIGNFSCFLISLQTAIDHFLYNAIFQLQMHLNWTFFCEKCFMHDNRAHKKNRSGCRNSVDRKHCTYHEASAAVFPSSVEILFIGRADLFAIFNCQSTIEMEMKLSFLSRAIKVHFTRELVSRLPANATCCDWFETAINKANRQKRTLRNFRDQFMN